MTVAADRLSSTTSKRSQAVAKLGLSTSFLEALQ